MNKLFTFTAIFLVMTANSIFAAPSPIWDEDESFNYVTVGNTHLIFPQITIGHREKMDIGAFDFSVGFASLLVANELSTRVSYLTYSNNNQFYFGSGAEMGFGVVFDKCFASFAPLFLFGKESKDNFHQLSIAPLEITNHGVNVTPLCFSYKYGFKF